ncbi:MAG: hypothetical protein F6K47_08650 [Symploca sp. SIO2E6]|nr:hypothetical protein [Symploca sp. SIO2E6]
MRNNLPLSAAAQVFLPRCIRNNPNIATESLDDYIGVFDVPVIAGYFDIVVYTIS